MDGGSHFDQILKKVPEYLACKDGVFLGIYDDGEENSTANYHLIMLRQLAYEILNSPDISDFLK